MSIPFEQKYKIFLIYFSGTKWQNCAVHICTVSDTPGTPPPLRSARRGLSGIGCRPVQRVQRPGVCVVPCVVCPATCYVQAVRVRWGGLGSPPAGYIAAAQPRPVSLSTTEKIKKTHPTFTKRNQSDCASLQIFQKIKKDPSPGLICAILDRKKGAL